MKFYRYTLLALLLVETGLLIISTKSLRFLGLAKLVIVEGESELHWSILAQNWRILLNPYGLLILATTITTVVLVTLLTGVSDKMSKTIIQSVIDKSLYESNAAEQRADDAEQAADQKYRAHYQTLLQQAEEAKNRLQMAEAAAHRSLEEARQIKNQAEIEVRQAKAEVQRLKEEAAKVISQTRAEKKAAETATEEAEKRRRNAAAMAARIKKQSTKKQLRTKATCSP